MHILVEYHGTDAHISYSYNRGKVNGTYGQVGGICGCTWQLGTNAVHHCYNIGTISGPNRIGSIVGQAYSSSISNCWWTVNPGLGNSGSMTASSQVTEETLKGYASNLGAEYFTEDDIGINDGFPILKWEKAKWEKENSQS